MCGVTKTNRIPTFTLRAMAAIHPEFRAVIEEFNEHNLDLLVTETTNEYGEQVDPLYFTCYAIDDGRNTVVGKAQHVKCLEAMAEAVILAQIPYENGPLRAEDV